MRAQKLNIVNPVRRAKERRGRSRWYPYYAGYSSEFAATLLKSAGLSGESLVLDPWNGAGTTTWACASLGLASIGIDINPVMTIVSRARLLSSAIAANAPALALRIAESSCAMSTCIDDPLLVYFDEQTASTLRALELAVRQHLTISREGVLSPPAESLSELAAFFYLALFRVARKNSRSSVSNPTWTKRDPSLQLGTSSRSIKAEFIAEVQAMSSEVDELGPLAASTSELVVGDSRNFRLADRAVDLVLTSPPYCTRIDYAVATALELSVLGYSHPAQEALRRKMMGTTSIDKATLEPLDRWGATANRFLEQVKAHSSKASSTYYYKNHLQYFDALSLSLRSVSSVVRREGLAVLIVQDSYYKDVHNDLAAVCEDMMRENGFDLVRREDFQKSVNLRSIHPHRSQYSRALPVESVLCFSHIP